LTVLFIFFLTYAELRKTSKKNRKEVPIKLEYPEGNEEETLNKIKENSYKFFDVGSNLRVSKYNGIYDEKKAHGDDINLVMNRARNYGVEKILITTNDLNEAREAYNLTQRFNDTYMSIGISTKRAKENLYAYKSDKDLFDHVVNMTQNEFKDMSKVKAIGATGLDYTYFKRGNIKEQKRLFSIHIDLAKKLNLPIILRSQKSEAHFLEILRERKDDIPSAIVSSFSGNSTELKELLDMGFYISISGVSFKKPENFEIIKQIPMDRLIIETNSPSGLIKPSHESFKYVKSHFKRVSKKSHNGQMLINERNEPCTMIQVSEVLAGILEKDEKEIIEQSWTNSCKALNISP
jgi:TatD DNase family protein